MYVQINVHFKRQPHLAVNSTKINNESLLMTFNWNFFIQIDKDGRGQRVPKFCMYILSKLYVFQSFWACLSFCYIFLLFCELSILK